MRLLILFLAPPNICLKLWLAYRELNIGEDVIIGYAWLVGALVWLFFLLSAILKWGYFKGKAT